MNAPPPVGPIPLRLRLFAVALMAGGVAMAYFFLYQPLLVAERTGSLSYSMKAVILPPMLIYTGIVMLFTDVRDGQIRQPGADGKPKLTSKGWSFVVGLMVVMGLAFAGWYLLLRSLGFQTI